MRPSCIACCAAALWLALGGPGFAQIGGIAPQVQVSAQPVRPTTQRPVQPAAHQESLPLQNAPEASGRPYYEEENPVFNNDWGPSCGPTGCNFCGQRMPGCGPFGQGCLSGFYVRSEYLLWGTRGMDLPPLVTTSPVGTPQNQAGVIGEPGTGILFGGDSVGGDLRSGGRLVFGWWFDPCRRLGVEADYFVIADDRTDFQATSNGTPILGRPFFDVVQGVENVNLVAFPNLIQGTIAAEHFTSFQGSGVRALYNLACGDGGGTSWITGCPVHSGFRYDMLLGYRFLRLDDRVSITENSVSLDTGNPGSFIVNDLFDTENQFHGVDVGTTLSFCKGCWSLEMLSKVAIGNTHSTTTIDGSTIITQNAVAQNFQGGLLAQRTNIGIFTDDQLAVVPELGVTAGYQLNPCWRATIGYSFVYWSQVARAGDQLDRDVNPNLLPPEGPPPVTTNLRPEFNWLYTDYWAQGMNVGLEGRW